MTAPVSLAEVRAKEAEVNELHESAMRFLGMAEDCKRRGLEERQCLKEAIKCERKAVALFEEIQGHAEREGYKVLRQALASCEALHRAAYIGRGEAFP